MNRKRILAGITIIIVLSIAGGIAFFTSLSPGPGGATDTETRDEVPPPNDYGPTAFEQDDSVEQPPFSYEVTNSEDCGLTCRDVTATLHNNQNETATNVTVFIRIYAGQNTTEPSNLVWEGSKEIGTLHGDDSYTTTLRVELSFKNARKIERNDGWITIQTKVETDKRVITLLDSEIVS